MNKFWLAIGIVWLRCVVSVEGRADPRSSRIFWEQLSSSGIVPIEVNVPDTVLEMAQGVGQVYTNVNDWWQGAKPSSVVTSAPEKSPVKKPKTQPKKKTTTRKPGHQIIINVMKEGNMTLPDKSTVRSTVEPKSTTKNKRRKTGVKINLAAKDNSVSYKKKKPTSYHSKYEEMYQKQKKKKQKQKPEEVHVVHHYNKLEEQEHYEDEGWDDEDQFGEEDSHEEPEHRPVKKRKPKQKKKKQSTKKKGKNGKPSGSTKSKWDMNNFLYFFMGLFGIWPGTY